MKLAVKFMIFGLILSFFLLGMVTVWHNCGVTAFGEEPALAVTVEENGTKTLQLGRWETTLYQPEELLEAELFCDYPALLPGSIRLLGGAAARREEILLFCKERWEDFCSLL